MLLKIKRESRYRSNRKGTAGYMGSDLGNGKGDSNWVGEREISTKEREDKITIRMSGKVIRNHTISYLS